MPPRGKPRAPRSETHAAIARSLSAALRREVPGRATLSLARGQVGAAALSCPLARSSNVLPPGVHLRFVAPKLNAGPHDGWSHCQERLRP